MARILNYRRGWGTLLQARFFGRATQLRSLPRTMMALEATNYGSDGDLRINATRRVPTIKYPEQVLLHVQAASLNPIDHRIRTGYGQRLYDEQRLLNNLHHTGYELPLVLGRDCAGVVVDVGQAVQSVKVGDEVWGWIPDWAPGCISEFAILNDDQVRRKPRSLSFVEAASIPYVGIVLLSVFRYMLHYKPEDWKGKRVLIHGGGGGLGTLAVQILKSWGAYVTVTSLSRSEDLLLGLGADEVLYFRGKLFRQALAERDPYDIVIDTPGTGGFILDCTAPRGKYVTMQSPLAELVEDFGRVGHFKMFRKYLRNKFVQRWTYKRKFLWWTAIVMASVTKRHPELLDQLGDLVTNHGVVGVVQDIFSLEHGVQAFTLLKSGHTQGKTVISTMPLEKLQSLPEGERAELLDAGRQTTVSEHPEDEATILMNEDTTEHPEDEATIPTNENTTEETSDQLDSDEPGLGVDKSKGPTLEAHDSNQHNSGERHSQAPTHPLRAKQ